MVDHNSDIFYLTIVFYLRKEAVLDFSFYENGYSAFFRGSVLSVYLVVWYLEFVGILEMCFTNSGYIYVVLFEKFIEFEFLL